MAWIVEYKIVVKTDGGSETVSAKKTTQDLSSFASVLNDPNLQFLSVRVAKEQK